MRFRSITKLKADELEVIVFAGKKPRGKLQVDVTEVPGDSTLQFSLFSVTNIHHAVSQSGAAKWTMLTWTDFAYTGFTRTDAPLSPSSEISAPPTHLGLSRRPVSSIS